MTRKKCYVKKNTYKFIICLLFMAIVCYLRHNNVYLNKYIVYTIHHIHYIV